MIINRRSKYFFQIFENSNPISCPGTLAFVRGLWPLFIPSVETLVCIGRWFIMLCDVRGLWQGRASAHSIYLDLCRGPAERGSCVGSVMDDCGLWQRSSSMAGRAESGPARGWRQIKATVRNYSRLGFTTNPWTIEKSPSYSEVRKQFRIYKPAFKLRPKMGSL